MPTSILIDAKGCEIANLAGPAEWASDDAIKLIKAAVQPATAGLWISSLGGYVEIAADAGAEIGGRWRVGRPAASGPRTSPRRHWI